ncbi:hypothetical protein LQZ18_07520 [Lachnospiraceae bacterium ZAX-1]
MEQESFNHQIHGTKNMPFIRLCVVASDKRYDRTIFMKYCCILLVGIQQFLHIRFYGEAVKETQGIFLGIQPFCVHTFDEVKIL